MSAHPDNRTPTRASAFVFRLKTAVLQANRFVRNQLDRDFVAHKIISPSADIKTVGESSTPLWSESDPAERALQLGKVQNLRTAIKKLNGVQVPANAHFSFWAQLGLPVRSRGYVAGRELREGCIVPSIAGGLCQLSNALYDAALQADFEIIERHAHSKIVPGSVAEQGRDATIFWNYVDLRFRSKETFRIEISMTDEKLIVRFLSHHLAQKSVTEPVKQMLGILPMLDHSQPNSCMSCGVIDCFRSPKVSILPPAATTAYMVDEYWPEFDRYINNNKSDADTLFLPIDGRKFNKANYAWTVDGFAAYKEKRFFTAMRSFESRSLAQQGASRQRALLKQQKQLADAYASSLDYRTTHLVVAQTLLPFLWEAGVLGGRTFDVLMTNLPLPKLHERLDGAHAMHADSSTLADFRADETLVRLEVQALRAARRIITPHSEIASFFGDRATLLDWQIPGNSQACQSGLGEFELGKDALSKDTLSKDTLGENELAPAGISKFGTSGASGKKIVFPASTLGRKGAYELREAARRLNLSIGIVGPKLEGSDFWQGLPVEELSAENWLDNAAVVILPAWLEQKPRRLLQAVSQGVPVIASSACGLEHVREVTTVKTGDVDALCAAIEAVLSISRCRPDVLPGNRRPLFCRDE